MLPATLAQAQDTTVRIIVGFPSGGGADFVARLLAEHMKERIGAPVIVDNRPGAGGVVAARSFLQAPADGRTLILANDHMLSVVPQTIAQPGYDPARDFAAVGTVAIGETALAVHPRTSARTLGEYVAWLRAHPREDVVGVPAPGSAPEFMVAMIGQLAQMPLRAAPYKGGTQMIQDLIGGQIPAGIATAGELFTYHQAGQLRMVALTGTKRMPLLPNVPTFGESGIAGLENSTYLALFTRAGTLTDAVSRLNQALREALEAPKLREGLASLSMLAAYEAPAELALRRDRSVAVWSRIIKASGYQPQ